MTGRGAALVDAPLVSDALIAELFAPLRLRNAGEHVADRLMTAIALGEFVPGQRLPTERELAATLAVSRTTVREAISRLAATGIVAVRRGRHGGTFVLADSGPESDAAIRRTLVPGWAQLERLLDLRTLLEPLIARTAAERRSEGDRERIGRRSAGTAARAPIGRPPAGRTAPSMRRSPRRPRTPTSSTSATGSARRSASASGRSPTRLRSASARSVSTRSWRPRSSSGRPEDAARIARRHFALTEDRLRELSIAARRGSREPAPPICRPSAAGHHPDPAGHERLRLPDHPARARRSGAHDARLPRHRPERGHHPDGSSGSTSRCSTSTSPGLVACSASTWARTSSARCRSLSCWRNGCR